MFRSRTNFGRSHEGDAFAGCRLASCSAHEGEDDDDQPIDDGSLIDSLGSLAFLAGAEQLREKVMRNAPNICTHSEKPECVSAAAAAANRSIIGALCCRLLSSEQVNFDPAELALTRSP